MSLYDQIKSLHTNGLHSNVISLTNLVLSLSDHNADILPLPQKLETYIHYADAHYNLGKYRRAESLYKKALQFRKCLLKTKNTKAMENVTSDVEIKFMLHQCLVKLEDMQEALQVLQSIPGKQRTAKVNMALAKTFQDQGSERSAIAAYKEVLRECPLALDAAEGLLSLGVKGIEVSSIIVSCAASLGNLDWLNSWVRAHALIHGREYMQAVSTLRSLETVGLLRDNHSLVTAMGECYYLAGDDKNAQLCFRRARMIEPDITKGVDAYAAVLYRLNDTKELDRLIPTISNSNERSPEMYVAMAYNLCASRKFNRANVLAAQALALNPNDIEATILRGNILLEQKKYQDALHYFRQAVHIKPYRYEPHKGFVDCLVGMHRLREALNFASGSCKQLGHTPRVLTLYASVLMKDPVSVGKAKNLLEKALNQDEAFLPAVYLLAEIYEHEMNFEAAIELLERQLETQSTWRVHHTLGDLWARLHNEEKALDYYTVALKYCYNIATNEVLEPNNRRTLDAMQRLASTSAKLDSAYYMAVGEEQADTTYDVGDGLPDTDIEEPPDESETEAVWSDMDLEANSQ